MKIMRDRDMRGRWASQFGRGAAQLQIHIFYIFFCKLVSNGLRNGICTKYGNCDPLNMVFEGGPYSPQGGAKRARVRGKGFWA